MSGKKITLWLFGILLGIVLLIGFGWGWRYVTAPIRGQVEMRENVESGDFRQYSYEHFYGMYAQIQTYDKRIEAQKQRLKNATGEKEKRRIRSNIAGLKSQRASLINQYNTDARMEKTRGQFRSNDLPREIEHRTSKSTTNN